MSECLKDEEKITMPVTGEPVSIWSGELKNIIYAIDDKIVRALRTALENRTGFEVNAKITFAPMQHNGQTLFAVTYKTNHKFDPIQVEYKAALNDFLPVAIDEYGRLVIPDDAEYQTMLDD